jgi:hypothetical protein
MKKLLLPFLLFFALPLFAYTVTPTSGPAAGGTVVTIKGQFGDWPYGVSFGAVEAQSVTRIDSTTLQAVTPAHLPGVVNVRVFEYDIWLGPEAQFEFIGEEPLDAFERVLLPVFTAPVKGAFGSEFRTELNGMNTGRNALELFGFDKDCAPLPECIFSEGEFVLRLEPFGTDLNDSRLVPLGNPGYFFYVPKAQAKDLSANLRAYDTSRAAENFGTEIPIVTSDEFRTQPFALTGVPRDARFRSTLRIYAAAPTTVRVIIDGELSFVTLNGGDTRYPAYAQFSNFPIGTGTTRVTIEPAEGEAVWAFISVTNNQTQHITTITPRP